MKCGYVYGLERISQSRGDAKHYYVADGQGSIRALTDTAGAVTDTYFYTAFGDELAKTGTTENEFRYVGEQWDPNAGFYYLRARWYDQSTGRFASIDPFAGDPQAPVSLHRYLFGNVDPISYYDPTGKMATLNEFYASMAIGSILNVTLGAYRGETTLKMVAKNAIWGAVEGGLTYTGTLLAVRMIAQFGKILGIAQKSIKIAPMVNPTVGELRSMGSVKGFQVHHILPQYLGKMLGYTEGQMVNHPGAFITQFSHTGKLNPDAVHKVIRTYLKDKGVTYSADEIYVGLENAYTDLGVKEWFSVIAHLIN